MFNSCTVPDGYRLKPYQIRSNPSSQKGNKLQIGVDFRRNTEHKKLLKATYTIEEPQSETMIYD